MDKPSDRRKSYKSPPISSDSGRSTQELRRAQALEEQKRRRLLRVDASRQLDQFADLTLGLSDDESVEPDGGDATSLAPTEGISRFAGLLPHGIEAPPQSRSPSPYQASEPEKIPAKKKRRKGKNKGKSKSRPSKWANKCMYAELLEMNDDPLFTMPWSVDERSVGLPADLESAWVALAPIPVGKRCLAVTMQSAGVSGIVPNTMLRSRLLGKILLPPFPSPLPPNTILDCILDQNWRSNGLLHVLDVVRWKDQDVAGCEASFRFWWRDTRLLELPIWPTPPPHKSSYSNVDHPTPSYKFPYPSTFLSVPFTTPTTFSTLLSDVIPRARAGRVVSVTVPVVCTNTSSQPGALGTVGTGASEEGMQIDFSFGQEPRSSPDEARMQKIDACVSSDGLLLYLGEAAYESGESPLSVWVPRLALEGQVREDAAADAGSVVASKSGQNSQESPLDRFERLVSRRLATKQSGLLAGVAYPVSCDVVEVEMEP